MEKNNFEGKNKSWEKNGDEKDLQNERNIRGKRRMNNAEKKIINLRHMPTKKKKKLRKVKGEVVGEGGKMWAREGERTSNL